MRSDECVVSLEEPDGKFPVSIAVLRLCACLRESVPVQAIGDHEETMQRQRVAVGYSPLPFFENTWVLGTEVGHVVAVEPLKVK